jgi:UDP-N-acetylmuramoyl-L-alanyl-D-glutamate--2,6-diaminopimelate ligase
VAQAPGEDIGTGAEAIRHAIADAEAGDVVVIAGKGHEDYQIVGTEKRAFSDRETVQACLSEGAA